jgi:hypothetical protein
MAHDVFISYPHQNKTVADAACAKLEAAGIRCWIAPRDIAPSAEWAASIVEGIDLCRVMVLIFSAHANDSRQIHREVQHAFDSEKTVVPFRLEDVLPLGMMRYYMGSVHWLDALTPPLDQHLEDVWTLAIIIGAGILQGLINVFIGKILAQDLNYEVTEGLVFFTTAVTLSYGIRRGSAPKPAIHFDVEHSLN